MRATKKIKKRSPASAIEWIYFWQFRQTDIIDTFFGKQIHHMVVAFLMRLNRVLIQHNFHLKHSFAASCNRNLDLLSFLLASAGERRSHRHRKHSAHRKVKHISINFAQSTRVVFDDEIASFPYEDERMNPTPNDSPRLCFTREQRKVWI